MITIDKISQTLLQLQKAANLPPYDPVLLADVLIDEFQKNWSEMPVSTREAIIGVAASLKKHHFDNLASDIKALEVVKNMKKSAAHPSTNLGN